jgi:hypothetical protein
MLEQLQKNRRSWSKVCCRTNGWHYKYFLMRVEHEKTPAPSNTHCGTVGREQLDSVLYVFRRAWPCIPVIVNIRISR